MTRTDPQLITRIAHRYPRFYMRSYARRKLQTDPVYEAVRQRLQGCSLPVLDIGCGIGLCELYLREHGYTGPMFGIDPDAGKIELACRAAATYHDVMFESRDGAEAMDITGHVVMLDVLHYFTVEVQAEVLTRIAARIPAGGWCVIRATPIDSGWRFRCTQWEERFAHAIRWMRRPAMAFPTREAVVAPFERAGFTSEVRPLWGHTPFNSYLFAFQRT